MMMDLVFRSLTVVALVLSLGLLFTGSEPVVTEKANEVEAPEEVATISETEMTQLALLVEELSARLESLETSVTREPVGNLEVVAESASDNEELLEEPPAGDESEGSADAELEEFELLLAQVVRDDGMSSDGMEARERFFEMASKGNFIPAGIDTLEAEVEADPHNLEARMKLADYYIAKLLTVSGPEQGLWGGKAETQWKEVAGRDEQSWESRARLGTSYAYYPEVMNKTGESIKLLEEAREITERLPAEDSFIDTYLFLSRMYVRQDQIDRAKQVLQEGLAHHVEDERLTAELAKLDNR